MLMIGDLVVCIDDTNAEDDLVDGGNYRVAWVNPSGTGVSVLDLDSGITYTGYAASRFKKYKFIKENESKHDPKLPDWF